MKIPGFVDLQVNGHKGIDFSNPDLTTEEFLFACNELVRKGTVAFLPTIITSSPSVFKRNLGLMAKSVKQHNLQNAILGFHVEGPFISKKDGARGAHHLEWVQQPDINLLDKLYKWSDENIKLLTIAAEIPGATALCKYATTELGITVSLGHQMATKENMKEVVDAGARSLTHLGNGIPRNLHRHHNPLWAGIANDDLSAMIISDSHHIPPSIIKTIIRTKGASKVIVVSDASPISGLPPGEYNALGNDVILENSGRLYNPETGYLVGSSSTMLDCMNYLFSLNLLTLEELFDAGFYNPLRLINIDSSVILRHTTPKVEYKDDQFHLK